MDNFRLIDFMKAWQQRIAASPLTLQEGTESYGASPRQEFMNTMRTFVDYTRNEWAQRYPTSEDVLRGYHRSEIDDEKALEILWAWNFPYLVRLADSYTWESLEVLVISTFEPFRKAAFQYEESKKTPFLAYLKPYVEGAMKDEVRKNGLYRQRNEFSLNTPLDGEMENVDYRADDRPDPSALIEEEDTISHIKNLTRKALKEAGLTEKQARVIEMIYFQDLKPVRVAEILQIDATSVRDAHQGAMKKLRKYLSAHKEGL
ncbi:sigma-70 family RNA polymerase sigma factor [Dialister sp.]|uniref:sigma-70 family RNA polymerase sigma factor n=1 Tax=Dialister sp. TaxID=1955814 RepID=UPI002E815EAD|nr:sigma-70 family RNA polymerase sigma factor [Dialister sp.]MEE3453458.1 sigma-70 family RNA polymerase sigma factor [Dialister sp.]